MIFIELTLLAVFALAILLCMRLGLSVLIALAFGNLLFFSYGLFKKHSLREMLRFSLSGLRTVRNVLLTFLLIGMLTAVWRACGSIATIVYAASAVCAPSVMLLMTFLLCGLISFLTGTSFGTSATMGVICVTMANAMGLPIAWTGGAMLAGAFFGDRCSPVSTSALLVSALTQTELPRNIRVMAKSAVVPFLISCAVYIGLGFFTHAQAADETTRALFAQSYTLSPLTLLPVAAVLLLSMLRVSVRPTLAVSVALAIPICVGIQGLSPRAIPALLLYGFHPEDARLAAMMGGGGILSMVRVFCIVGLSSCYAGIFEGTGFLDGIRAGIGRLAKKTNRFGATLVVSVLSAVLACNQTLAIMLTHQLCVGNYSDGTQLMSDLENSVVVVSALVPWCIAGAVPLSTVGAPSVSMLFAVYLWLLPLWTLLQSAGAASKRAEKPCF